MNVHEHLRGLQQRYIREPWGEQAAWLQQIPRWLGQMLTAGRWGLLSRPYFLDRHPHPKSPSVAPSVQRAMVESTCSPRDRARGGRFPVKWLPLITICAVLYLTVGPGVIQAQMSIAAPTIDSVTPGNGSLTTQWTAPTGVTGITAYDLRYIETSADETVDDNWTKIEDVWTGSGDLEYVLLGLDNGVGYEVQMRAVTTADGAWSSTSTGTPRIPGAMITSVVAGDSALTIVWNAPAVADTTTIGAYDVRHIRSDAADKADANWTVVDDFWTSGGLDGVLPGLTNGAGYDVQVRAVAVTDGAWSATSTGTPAEHGGTTDTATTLMLGTPIGGNIDPGTDADYFELVLGSAATILIRTSGDLDTVGELQHNSGATIKSNNDGRLPESPENFVIWWAAQAGTYYVKVSSNGEATGAYVLQAITITDSMGRPPIHELLGPTPSR